MDPGGFEPPTFSMPLRRAPNCAMGPSFSNQLFMFFGQLTRLTDYCLHLMRYRWSLSCGPEGIRTPGLLSAIEARSQLRYRPVPWAWGILHEAGGNVKETAECHCESS